MPVELTKSFVNVLEALGEQLEQGQFKPVHDNLLYPDGTTLAENFPELFLKIGDIANALGIDYDACEYTFTVSKSSANGRVYINYPSVRLVDEVPTLCWGEVKRPISELDAKALALKEVASMSNKPGARPKYFLDVKFQKQYWASLGQTSVAFPLSTVADVNPITLSEAIDADPSDANYRELWSKVLRASGSGNFKPFAQSLGKIFMKHPEVDPASFIDSVRVLLEEPACESLSMRVVVQSAETEAGRFGASLVMDLYEAGYSSENPYAAHYGRYKTSLKSQLGQKYDPGNPGQFEGTEFTVVAEDIGNMNGSDYVKTRIEALVLPFAKNGSMPSWGNVSGF